ncbi:cell division protein FtsZ [Spongiivirga citrea]|uniref:Cell division protein FtsZ n=1 Tax=Spongiivirga citrea TaxID=1481457 RepID=A0A6M0CK14_9FLAO|nr:cell division protein FtsZ [Spongiivirga citrea]NER18298.1 cell division protein FtsZ [Spongiivirga citrea]
MSTTEFENNIDFDLPKNQSNVIKVIGVGGGGSNAINYMFQLGIKGVDFVICNTDAQALENSSIPNKIQLGVSLTEGLGAGANPEIGERSAVESYEDIKAMLSTNTKMIFITAGMGGGTGTGAAPIIAKMAKEMDILTVGIVTIPFQFEGKMRNEQAQLGVENLRQHVDSLIVINNNKLREVYGNLGFKAGFAKADEVLATASRGIAEVITHHYTQNIDLRDAKTVLSNSGTAIMGSASSSGSNRANEAIMKALDSPLLNDNKIKGAKNVLLLIVSGTEEITIDEIGEINDHIQTEAGHSANIIMGVGEDVELDNAISVTIIATGFNAEQQDEIVNTESKKIIHTLGAEQGAIQDLNPKKTFDPKPLTSPSEANEVKEETPKIVRHVLLEEDEEPEPAESTKSKMDLIPTTELIRNIDVVYEEVIDVVAEEAVQEVEEEITFETPEPIAEEEDDFIITPVVNEIEVNEPKVLGDEEQFTLTFDLPLSDTAASDDSEEEVLRFDLSEEVKDMDVVDAEEVVAQPVQVGDETRYSLEDYMEVESTLNSASAEVTQEEVDQELAIQKKVVAEQIEEEASETDEVDPFNSSISDLMKERANERKKTMKDFNYKFRTNASKIDDIEKIPAYKRMGVDLDDSVPSDEDPSPSRTTLGTDENDDLQLRSNNSFLHDNVD